MSQLISKDAAFATIATVLNGDAMQGQLMAACTRSVTPERLARIALTEMRRTPKLMDCSIQSICGALMQCAQLGLEPGPMGLAYLIPYGQECQFQLGYRGILNLMWRSELVSSIQSEVVYEGDHFQFANGIPPKLVHVPADDPDPDAKPTHAFCVIGTTKGGWVSRVMTFKQIENVRNKYSKGKSSDSPWVTSWGEMACKTVIKATAKRAPVSAESQQAISLDDLSEIGMRQNLGATIDVPTPTEEGGGSDVAEDSTDSGSGANEGA